MWNGHLARKQFSDYRVVSLPWSREACLLQGHPHLDRPIVTGRGHFRAVG